MSATYVIGKFAAACVDERGTVFYQLQELSYESNVSPRSPRWSVTFFGTYEACIARMIWGSGSVEGGSLKGDAKTPSAFITQWRKKLASPGKLSKRVITVEFGKSLYKLPEEHRLAISELLLSRGFPAVENNKLVIDMNADGALQLLADLCDGRFEGVYAWRLFEFKPSPEHAEPAPELGTPVPDPVRVDLDVTVYTLGSEREGFDEQNLIAGPEGVRMSGWDYSTVDSFISREVLDMERQRPGAAEPAIAAFRKLMKVKSRLPEATRIHVKRPAKQDDWETGKFVQLCEELKVPAADVVTLSPSQVSGDVVRLLTTLGNKLVQFEIPGGPAQAASEQLALAA